MLLTYFSLPGHEKQQSTCHFLVIALIQEHSENAIRKLILTGF